MCLCVHTRVCVCNCIVCVHVPPATVRKSEVRQEFIIEKYIAMKYTSQEDKERILEERT